MAIERNDGHQEKMNYKAKKSYRMNSGARDARKAYSFYRREMCSLTSWRQSGDAVLIVQYDQAIFRDQTLGPNSISAEMVQGVLL